MGAQRHAEGCHRQPSCRRRGDLGRSVGTPAARRLGPGNLASRATDARGARRPAKGRDRKVVADHQGGEHQGGMKWLACLHFRGNAVKLPRRNFLHLAAGAAALPAASRVAWAQAYPMRPVRIIVPFPAGQATDTIARLMGQSLSDPGVACSSLLLLKTTEHRRRRVAAPLTCRWIAMREHRRFGQAGCCARAAHHSTRFQEIIFGQAASLPLGPEGRCCRARFSLRATRPAASQPPGAHAD
jgi:hypothetical protein